MLVNVHFAVVAVDNLELYHRAVGNVGREMCNEALCYLLIVGLADVLKIGQTLALEKCRRADEHLRRETEQPFFLRLLLCHTPRGGIAEEDKINNFLIQLPCRCEVGANISASDGVTV